MSIFFYYSKQVEEKEEEKKTIQGMHSNYGRFGALLGTIYIGHTHCKFLVRLYEIT